MKSLPKTEALISVVDKTIDLLDSLRIFDINLLFSENLQEITDYQAELYSALKNTDFSALSSEHWNSCDNLEDMKAFKIALEGLFSSLLDWRPEFRGETKEFIDAIRIEQRSFIHLLKVRFPDMDPNIEKTLKSYYKALNSEIIFIRSEILKVLQKWERMTHHVGEEKKQEPTTEEIVSEKSAKIADFTTKRQVLAIFYLFHEFRDAMKMIDNTHKARFIEFLTGKNYDNIYKAISNPLKGIDEENNASLIKDLNYVKDHFTNLGLYKIATKIENDIGS